MFPVEAFRSTVLKFVAILQEYSIPFHLTGGVTSTAYGEPRMTQDIDIVVDNESLSSCLNAFIVSLEQNDFMKSDDSIRQAVASRGMFQLLDNSESLKLDIYARELVIGELQRSRPMEVFEGVTLPVVARADAAISKLFWIQKGSHKSRRDLRKIWEGSSDKERGEISAAAMKAKIAELLDEVIKEPDEIDTGI